MSRGQRRGESERARWVSRWQASGLSAAEFAARHGLAVSTLYQWQQRLAAREVSDVDFAEVRVVGKSRPRASVILELRNGVRVEIGDGIDLERLAAVLKVASAC